MENKVSPKIFIPIFVVFIPVNCFLLFNKNWLATKETDQQVLMWGNLLLAILSIISFGFYIKGMSQKSTQGFLRNVYSAMLLKLFVCMIAAFVYIYSAGSNVNKPALFGCMFLYLIYTFIEMRGVMRFNKSQK